MVSYLLGVHERTLDRDYFGASFNEALLHYVAHILYLSMVEARTQAQAKERSAAEGDVPEENDFRETGLNTNPALSSYALSPYGRHFATLMNSQGPSVMVVDVEWELTHGRRLAHRDNRGCCG